MNTTKTVSYKGWILSIHCVSVPGGERNGKYTAIGFLDSEAGMGNRQDGGAQTVVHLPGTHFDTADNASRAILKEAKRLVDLQGDPSRATGSARAA